MTNFSRAPRAATITAAAAGVFLVAVVATTGSETDGYACTDTQGTVVSDDNCERASHGGSGGYFYSRYSPASYPGGPSVGTPLVSDQVISPSDSAARANAGLPATGRVANGTTVKSGGFGSGKGGSFGG